MNAIDEARWNRNRRDSELTPHTAGAEDPETTPEEIAGMVGKIFNVGYERKRELDEMTDKRDGPIEHLRDGSYWIRYAHNGQYADFTDKANYEYLKKKYPFLHSVSEGVGFDEDKGAESHGTFEDFLGSIPHEDWTAFMEDMDTMSDYPSLDDDRASELEMEEGSRWVTEDGGPDLIESMRKNVDDAYEGYLLSKVTTDLIFDWMRETDHYPEAQGQGDVWMKMEELGAERETQEWFLDHLDDDVKGWTEVKKAQFEDQAGDMLDRVIRQLAQKDEEIAHVYNRIDADILWNIFLQTFPDEPRTESDPHWYFWKPQYNVPGIWRVGYESESHNLEDWKRGLADALTYVGEQEWFGKLIRGWFNRAPEGHPEFKLEALGDDEVDRYVRQAGYAEFELTFDFGGADDSYGIHVQVPRHLLAGLDDDTRTARVIEYAKANETEIKHDDWNKLTEIVEFDPLDEALEQQQPDPDDPETFLRYGGGLAEEVVYEDDRIVVMYPRDFHTLNYHLRRAGLSEIDKRTWNDLFYHKDIFVVLGKTAADMLGHSEKRELGVIWGDENGLRVFTGMRNAPEITQILKNPEYGRNVRRMLLQYYRERLEGDWKAANVLLQIGGAPEVRRAERRGLMGGDMSTAMGLYYVAKHKYGLAAKAMKRSPSTITPKGVWLFYDDVSDLTSVFKNEDAASTVFANDHYDWFQHYWESANRPEVGDVIPFLDEKAKKHIREIMVNRRVWFPDGGPEGRGEYAVLTPQVLAQYDDDTILDWIANPSDEDKEDGVFDDITEALQTAGVKMLEQTAIDAVYIGYIKEAAEAIGGTEHKWVKHPTKKGSDAFAVFVPWEAINEQSSKFQEEHGYPYDGSLESLAVDINADTAEVNIEHLEPGWRDVNKDYAKDYAFDDLYELEAPDPQPGAPNYEDPNQLTLPMAEGVDDPEAMPAMFSGVPVEFENRVKAILKDSMTEYHYTIRDLKFELKPSQEYSDEDIDASDGRLYNRPVHRILLVSYLPEPPPDWGVEQWVFRKVRETAINVFKGQSVANDYILNPASLDEQLPEDLVIFQFSLYDTPEHLLCPQPAPEEVPF